MSQNAKVAELHLQLESDMSSLGPTWAQASQMADRAIRIAEGYRGEVYDDGLGFLTVGIGHQLMPGEGYEQGQRLTSEQIETLYAEDFQIAAHTVMDLRLTINNPARIAVLIEMAFCLGENKLRKFRKMIASLCAGDYKDAGAQILDSYWYKMQGEKLAGIRTRLERMAEQMVKGEVEKP